MTEADAGNPPPARDPAAAAVAAAAPGDDASDLDRIQAGLRAAARLADQVARDLQETEHGKPPPPDLAGRAQALVATLLGLKTDAAGVFPLFAHGAHLADRVARMDAAPTEDGVLAEALDAIIAITGARRGFVVTIVNRVPQVRLARNLEGAPLGEVEQRLSRSILHDALQSGEPLLVANALEHPRYGLSAGVAQAGSLSVLVAPFRVAGEVAGAVVADNDRREGMFAPALLPRIARFLGMIAGALERVRTLDRLGQETSLLRQQLRRLSGFEAVVGTGPAMSALLRRADQFAQSPWPVLLLGEPGTGKELLARAIHLASRRSGAEFLTLNLAAIPETLAEDTLFGHEAGAFAEARKPRKGYFESAHGGTLFLDEVGEAPPAVQVKLLRAVQFGEIQRLGSDRPLTVDVRLVAATNRDLARDAQDGRFRADLLARLNPLTLRIPPLRERREDIPPLVGHFLRKYEAEVGKTRVRIAEGALARLAACPFQGTNVRGLENAVKYMLTVAPGDLLTEAHLPPEAGGGGGVDAGAGAGLSAGESPAAVAPVRAVPANGVELEAAKAAARDELDRAFIERAVAAAGGNLVKAAADTGVDRSWFYKRGRQLGLALKERAGDARREARGGRGE